MNESDWLTHVPAPGREPSNDQLPLVQSAALGQRDVQGIHRPATCQTVGGLGEAGRREGTQRTEGWEGRF